MNDTIARKKIKIPIITSIHEKKGSTKLHMELRIRVKSNIYKILTSKTVLLFSTSHCWSPKQYTCEFPTF